MLFDAKGTSYTQSSGADPIDWTNLTVGSGVGRILLVTIVYSAAARGGSMTVKWDFTGTPQSCTLIGEFDDFANSGYTLSLWGLVAPTSGNKTLRITGLSGLNIPNAVYVDAISFTGGQTSFAAAFKNNVGNRGNSITVTSAENDMVVGLFAGATISSTNGNNIFISGNGIAAACYLNGASPNVTPSSTTSQAAIGVNIAAFVDIDSFEFQQTVHLPSPTKIRRWASFSNQNHQNVVAIPDIPPWQFSPQEVQPPHLAPERRSAGTMRGDEGNQAIPIIPLPEGWHVQPPQPPSPCATPQHRAAATMRGDDGLRELFPFNPWRENVRYNDVSRRVMSKRGFDRGSDGIEAPVPIPFVGWLPVLPDIVKSRLSAAVLPADFSSIVLPFVSAAEWAFDAGAILKVQRRVAGADMEPTLPVFPRVLWGWDAFQAPSATRRPAARNIAPAQDISQPFSIPVPWGEQTAASLARAARRLAWPAELVVPPAVALTVAFERDCASPMRRRAPVLIDLYRYVERPYLTIVPWSETPTPQLASTRQRRGASHMAGDGGVHGALIISRAFGWEPVVAFPPHPHVERFSALALGEVSGAAWGRFSYVIPSAARPSDGPVWQASSAVNKQHSRSRTLVQLSAVFYSVPLNVTADPATVLLWVEDPLGNVARVTSVVRSGVGYYSALFMPTSPGLWKYKWQGAGVIVQATSPDATFFVRSSDFLPELI